MWEWIIGEMKVCCKILKIREYDEIISDIYTKLLEKPDLAKEIYEEKKRQLLIRLIKNQIFENEAREYGIGKADLSRYLRIMKICEENQITAIPENAYKINALDGTYSIQTIAKVLKKASKVKKDELQRVFI